MTDAAWAYTPPAQAARPRLADRYLTALSVCLLGYALFGRAFAYLGVPPLFIGEAMLALGLGAVALARPPRRVVVSPAMGVAVVFLLWVAVRTVPYVSGYGTDALRDAMVAGYALFAFVVAGLVMARPERLAELLVRYRVLVVLLSSVAWLIYLIFRINKEAFPMLPWADNVRVIENKPGDLLVHLAGITAFLVLRWRRPTPWLLGLLIVGVGAMMVGNRGGMLGYLLAMGVFAVLKPASATFGRMAYVGALLLVLAVVVDTSSLQVNEGNRSLSLEQLGENLKSVFGQSDQAMLADTAEWRLLWWGKIVDYTVFGDYRWTGKGFGRNLADEDGFNTDEEKSLRSPHSVHMTVLARGGLPGAGLWLLLHGLWWGGLLGAWRVARRAGLTAWQGFFAFCAVYWTAASVNASFDVYLEGPMGAIWFWCVWGAACAGTRLVRTHPRLLDGLAPSAPPPPAFAWEPRPASAPPGLSPEVPARGVASGPAWRADGLGV